MKAIDISVVLGLFLGVMVMCVGTAPGSMDSASMFGAWEPGGGCCITHGVQTCQEGTYGGQTVYCTGGNTYVCYTDPDGTKQCTAQGTNDCEHTGSTPSHLWWVCDETEDTLCQ